MMAGKSFFELGREGRTENWVWLAGFCALIFALYSVPSLAYRIGDVLSVVFAGEYGGSNPMRAYAGDRSVVKKIVSVFSLWFLYGVPGLAAIWLVQTRLRQRPLKDLMTTSPSFRWDNFRYGAYAMLFALAMAWFVMTFFPRYGTVEWVFNSQSLLYWPIIIVFLPIVTVLDEIVFRGFVCQWLQAKFNSTWITILISSLVYIIFAAQFYYYLSPDFGLPWAFLTSFTFAFAMAFLAVMTDGIELGLGASLLNSAFHTLIVAEHFGGIDIEFSLYSSGEPEYTPVTVLIVVAIYAICIVGAAYLSGFKKRDDDGKVSD